MERAVIQPVGREGEEGEKERREMWSEEVRRCV